MVNKRVAVALENLALMQRERHFYIKVKAFCCGNLSRADIKRRFWGKPAASAHNTLWLNSTFFTTLVSASIQLQSTLLTLP